MDFEALNSQEFKYQNTVSEFQEGTVQDDKTQATTTVAKSSPIVQTETGIFECKNIHLITKKTVGEVVSFEYFVERDGASSPLDEAGLSNYLSVLQSIYSTWYDQPVFLSCSMTELRQFVKDLGVLCKKYETDKNGQLKKNTGYLKPEFSFERFYISFKSVLLSLEKYLVDSLRFYIKEFSSGDGATYFGFDPTRVWPKEVAESRCNSCDITFTIFPRMNFSSIDVFPITKTGESGFDVPVENWFDVKTIRFKKANIEGSLISTDFSDLSTVQDISINRCLLFGDYSVFRSSLMDDSLRYAWALSENIRSSFVYAENPKPSWEDFCSGFVRPAITLVEEREWKTLQKDTKTLQDKLDEDKKIYSAAEKRKIVEREKGKVDETDAGILSDFKKEMKNVRSLEDLYAVLQKVRLGNLAKASLDCINKVTPVSPDEIAGSVFGASQTPPLIPLPNFSFPEVKFFAGPSDGVTDALVEQLKQIALAGIKQNIENFFVVENCEDFQKFTDKNAWLGLIDSLQSAIKEMWDLLVSAIRDAVSFGEGCYSPEDVLSVLYYVPAVFSPNEAEALFGGLPGAPEAIDLLALACSVFGGDRVRSCGIIPVSVIVESARVVGEMTPDIWENWRKFAPIQFESKIKCETSRENFIKWLSESGLPSDKVECIAEKTGLKKASFLRGLNDFVQNGGKQSGVDPFVFGDQDRQNISASCAAQFDPVFAALGQRLSEYHLYTNNGTGSQFGVTSADFGFVSGIDPSLDASIVMNIAGLEKPGNLDPNESFLEQEPEEFAPFWVLAFEAFRQIGFGDVFFPDYKEFERGSRVNFPGKYEVIEFKFRESTVALKKYFGPLRGHKRVVEINGETVPVFGTSFDPQERDSEIAPVWNTSFADVALRSLSAEQEERRHDWRDALFTGVVKEVHKLFIDFLVKEVNMSPMCSSINAGDVSIPFFEALSRKLELSAIPGCNSGRSAIGRDSFYHDVLSESEAVMKRNKTHDTSVVTKVGNTELVSRLAPVYFLLGAPFLGKMFKDFGGGSKILSNFILSSVPGAEDILSQNNEYVVGNYDRVFTTNDLARLQGGEDDEVIDNSGDEIEKLAFAQKYINSTNFATKNTVKNTGTIQRGIEMTGSGFANLLLSNKGFLSEWTNSLAFFQFPGLATTETGNFGDFSRQVLVGLCVEVKIGGRWVAATISSGETLEQGQNVCVVFPSGVNIGLIEAAESGLPVRSSFVLCVFASSMSRGVSVRDVGVRMFAPLVSVEFTPRRRSESAILVEAKQAVYSSQSFASFCRDYLSLQDIFETFNIFLFDVVQRTTKYQTYIKDCLVFKQDSASGGQQSGLQQAANDTFGIIRSRLSTGDIQKMALKMALKTPYLIFKSQVEMVDPVIRKARKIVDEAKLRGEEKDIAKVALVDLRPANIWLRLAKSPPITPLGILYVILERKNKNSEKLAELAQSPEEINSVLSDVFGSFCVEDKKQTEQQQQEVEKETC